MRVIVNQSTALGAKTGIGHYTIELLRGMRELAPEDSFHVFPPNWWGKVSRVGSYLRPRRGSAGTPSGVKPAASSWKTTVSRHHRCRDS